MLSEKCDYIAHKCGVQLMEKVDSNMGQDEITYKCLCDPTAGKVLSFFNLVVDY